MASTFAWLDSSDRERKRALDAIDQFRDEDTRDELGLGIIRDAFADRLFPGTSTIQTRTRYFLFVPWLFRLLKPADCEPERYAKRVRQLQDELRQSLVKGGQERGVIGYRAGGNVQRLPSSVYWQGLRRLGVMRFNGSETDYARYLSPPRDGLRNDDGEPVRDRSHAIWDNDLPEPPEGWRSKIDFTLSSEEGAYLIDRVHAVAPDSMLAHLLHKGVRPGDTRFPWEHTSDIELPPALGEEMGHAQNFSETMHGAALLYNLMLAQAKKDAAIADRYEEGLVQWWETLKRRVDAIGTWDRQRFWSLLAAWNASVRPQTRHFVEMWLDAVRHAPRAEAIINDGRLRDLVRMREENLKRGRARLLNPKALDQWAGQSGAAQLNYRWDRPVRQMLDDLISAGTKAA